MNTEVKHKHGTNAISAGPRSSNPTLAVLEQPFASANQWPSPLPLLLPPPQSLPIRKCERMEFGWPLFRVAINWRHRDCVISLEPITLRRAIPPAATGKKKKTKKQFCAWAWWILIEWPLKNEATVDTASLPQPFIILSGLFFPFFFPSLQQTASRESSDAPWEGMLKPAFCRGGSVNESEDVKPLIKMAECCFCQISEDAGGGGRGLQSSAWWQMRRRTVRELIRLHPTTPFLLP